MIDISGKIQMSTLPECSFRACCEGSQQIIHSDYDNHSNIVYKEFSSQIIACKSDLSCPTIPFSDQDIKTVLADYPGTTGITEAKLIAQLNDGRYAMIRTWYGFSGYYSKAVVSRDLTGLYLFSLTKEERASIGMDALGITSIIT